MPPGRFPCGSGPASESAFGADTCRPIFLQQPRGHGEHGGVTGVGFHVNGHPVGEIATTRNGKREAPAASRRQDSPGADTWKHPAPPTLSRDASPAESSTARSKCIARSDPACWSPHTGPAWCTSCALRGCESRRRSSRGRCTRASAFDGVYRADLVVEASVIVELKTVDRLLPVHTAQLLTYLKLTGLRVGLLLNFNALLLKHGTRRLVLRPRTSVVAQSPWRRPRDTPVLPVPPWFL